MVYAQVHRFRDTVAAYLSGDKTQYLTPKDARKLARALNRAARSVDTCKFTESSDLTFELKAEDARGPGY